MNIKPYEKNAKKHPKKQIEQVANSIKEFGMNQPIVVDKNGVIIVGHGRFEALKLLKWSDEEILKHVKVIDISEEKANAYRLADNKLNESEWDMNLVVDELKGLSDEMIDLTGFEKDLIIEPDEKDDEVPEIPEEPKSKLGDIYQLGNHRLMCGDSTSVDDVEKLMNGNKADMVFTDPPYNVAYTGGMKKENGKLKSNDKKMIKNDKMDEDEFYQFLYDVYTNLKLNTKDKSAFYVFYAHSMTRQFISAFQDVGLKQRSIIIWHKTSGGFGDFMAQYMNAYEPCIYGSNGDAVNWYGANNEKTVWDMDKEKKCDLHPTMKPIPVVSRAIGNSSKAGDLVLDLFGGSGSTLIACEQLNRKCYMMELDPKYVDVIVQRYVDYTGNENIKLNGKDIVWEKTQKNQ